jgi:DNA (cytosine-5)-methyltransferase 1
MKILSLFSNIGVAEAYLHEIGFEVAVANELVERRADLFSKIYPNATMVRGDIQAPEIFSSILRESRKKKIDLILATPPCQGMSRAAGIPKEGDERNDLVIPTFKLVRELRPKYVFIENVKRFLEIKIRYCKKFYKIPALIKELLGQEYNIKIELIDTKDFGVPQTRKRVIALMTRKDIKGTWEIPPKDGELVTLEQSIGDLPSIDPYVTDFTEDELLDLFPSYFDKKKKGKLVSEWHTPPKHIGRQVITMAHTETGKTAFDNKFYFPKKKDGSRVNGFKSTYRRLRWEAPASTVTMDNRKISSQNNVHPGRFIGKDQKGNKLYSDPRALTLYEIMRITTIPDDWPVPKETSEAFLRSVIGEGIPPLFVRKVFETIGNQDHK